MDKFLENTFENIYSKNLWGPKENLCGDGSDIKYNRPLLEFLNNYISKNKIKNIFDLGCGDFALFKHLNFSDKKYFGVDIVKSLIESNNEKYKNSNVKFFYDDIRGFVFERPCDLIIIKDVFAHVDNSSCLQILFNIRNHKNILVINDIGSEKHNNLDIVTGGYRTVDINDWPFYAEAECVFSYTSKLANKKVMLVDGTKMFPKEILE